MRKLSMLAYKCQFDCCILIFLQPSLNESCFWSKWDQGVHQHDYQQIGWPLKNNSNWTTLTWEKQKEQLHPRWTVFSSLSVGIQGLKKLNFSNSKTKRSCIDIGSYRPRSLKIDSLEPEAKQAGTRERNKGACCHSRRVPFSCRTRWGNRLERERL